MSVPGEPSKTRKVNVWWYVEPDDYYVRHTTVRLTEGYSDESDIPKILAIRYLSGVEDAALVRVTGIEEVEASE